MTPSSKVMVCPLTVFQTLPNHSLRSIIPFGILDLAAVPMLGKLNSYADQNDILSRSRVNRDPIRLAQA